MVAEKLFTAVRIDEREALTRPIGLLAQIFGIVCVIHSNCHVPGSAQWLAVSSLFLGMHVYGSLAEKHAAGGRLVF